MVYTYAQLTAAAAQTTEELRAAQKAQIYSRLQAIGVTGVYSWTTGSVPSSQLEVFAWSLADYEQAQAYVAQGGLNDVAVGDALTTLADQFFDNQRAPGKFTVGQVLLTDAANAGPWTFQAESTSFSVGRGGLRFDGFGGTKTLPRGGTVRVDVRSVEAGVAYAQLAAGAINFFARGELAGVTVTNETTWLSGSGAVVGSDEETDDGLRARDTSKWGTLSVGASASAYEHWARGADPTTVTRVAVFSNLELLDPGRVDVVVAGVAGAVGPSVVQAVQDALAVSQVGDALDSDGDVVGRIPETARAVASSAANHAIAVSATVLVQREYNTPEFQAQVAADFAAFAAATPIGGGPTGVVSAERLYEVLTFRAGLSPRIIYDVQNFSPTEDVPLLYYEVPVFTLALTWSPV